MKRVGHLFEKITSFENLIRAYKKALRSTGKTTETYEFHFNLEKELLVLQRELRSDRYQPSAYRYFQIYDPKERTISVAPFKDRVVHHAVVRVLEPVFELVFIHDSYATRKNKGTHRAVKRTRHFLHKNSRYLKVDVEKYFDSMDHEILLGLIQRKIKDCDVIALATKIIRNNDVSRGSHFGKGLPIGNLTSQFFANVYLNPLDHYLKDTLGVKYYVRYMDDMALFSTSKEKLKELLGILEGYLDQHLKLVLNPRATMMNSRLNGIPFLGFRIFPNLIRIKKENLTRMKKRLLKKKSEYRHGVISEEALAMSARSMFAHAAFADSLRLRQKIMVPWAGAG